MRHVFILAGLLAAQPALADAPAPRLAQPPAAAPVDVPQDKGPQQVNVLVREFPVGGAAGWHVHAGVEVAYLVSGDVLFEQEGQPPHRQRAGEFVTVPRGVKHNATNVGTEPARLVVTLIVDKGQPLRTPVPAPAH